jgi:phosphoribosylglycinamide formyltransferase-1
MTKRWAIFISGTGSNMTALLEKRNMAHISLIVSSNPLAYGLSRARRRSIPTVVFNPKSSVKCDMEQISNWKDLIETLKGLNIDCIMLAGFMKILPPEFIKAFEGKIFNIHPSVLPAYPGTKSIERAFNDQVHSGASVHLVDEGIDTGKVLYQQKVRREENLEWTEMMVHILEHKLSRKVFG